MDIVEFAENIMGVELQEWQKTHLRVLEKLPPNTDIRIAMGRRGNIYTYFSPKAQKELVHYGPTLNSHI